MKMYEIEDTKQAERNENIPTLSGSGQELPEVQL